jgi:4-amino-4-deoxy-L-arabinose transferase-like glycosyltransferase
MSSPPRLTAHPALQLALILACCVAVLLPGLGSRPLDFSEGHRAVPAWQMLAANDFWHQRLFELTYIRKPPGMIWAIALSSSLIGPTEFAARLVSVISVMLAAVAAWWFTRMRCQFDAPHRASPEASAINAHAPLFAGLLIALTPLLWSPGRSAEIEMLNNLGAFLAAIGLLGLLMSPTRHPPARANVTHVLAWSLLATLGTCILALAKGPAGAPVVLAALLAIMLAKQPLSLARALRLLIPLPLAAGILIPIFLKFAIANNDPDAVRQGVSSFLWLEGPLASKLSGVIGLAPVSAASAMPLALGLLILIPRASEERSWPIAPAARVLALAWLVTIAILMLTGVSNARYAMPAALLLAPPAGIVVARLIHLRPSPRSRRLAAIASASIAAILLALATTLALFRPRGDSFAGRDAARTLAEALPASATIWADDAIEARPDVLWYMQQDAHALGKMARVQWAKPALAARGPIAPGVWAVLRSDPESGECTLSAAPVRTDRIAARAQVRDYRFILLRPE